MSRLPTATTDQREQCTEAPGLSGKTPAENEMLILEEDIAFPLNLSLVQQTQQLELNKKQQIKKLLDDKNPVTIL